MSGRERRLDRLFQRVVVSRDGACVRCGATSHWAGPISAHHIVGRTAKNTRWDPDNGIALCPECHSYVEDHEDEAERIAVAMLGRPHYEELLARGRVIVRKKDLDLGAIEERLLSGQA